MGKRRSRKLIMPSTGKTDKKLQKKAFAYCDGRMQKNLRVNIIDVFMNTEAKEWNDAAVLYSAWLQKNSKLIVSELKAEW